jgi:hypothetical protein
LKITISIGVNVSACKVTGSGNKKEKKALFLQLKNSIPNHNYDKELYFFRDFENIFVIFL